MRVELDDGVEEAFGEASEFLLVCEGLEKGLNGVEKVGACEARDEGDAEGLGEVEVFAGGIENENEWVSERKIEGCVVL
ncbi:hypothetical protein Lalb_Chr25g0285541 [Lupinus albus]|uniref:Uncharacterized protein n=1 Tax=Lupinus albus TaxID=3870 RepID=A0A6A4N514_LUPAL|nr:hypothetical protein Lalb_Chr25g0285541 [Lupinus albus]